MYNMFGFNKRSLYMGIYIALGFASVIAIAIGIAFVHIVNNRYGCFNSYDCIYNKLCNIS